jgi:hypothetical protein
VAARASGHSVRTLDTLALIDLVEGRLHEARSRWLEVLARPDLTDPVRRAEISATALICLAYLGDPNAATEAEVLLGTIGEPATGLAAAWAWYGAGEAVLDGAPDLAAERLAMAVRVATACGAWFVRGVAGTSLASVHARRGRPAPAAVEYRWLLDHWNRSGEVAVLWVMLRSVAQVLADRGQPVEAATVLGAVTSSCEGHAIVGEDVERLATLAAGLQARLGRDAFEVAAARGRGVAVDEVVHIATRALGRSDG